MVQRSLCGLCNCVADFSAVFIFGVRRGSSSDIGSKHGHRHLSTMRDCPPLSLQNTWPCAVVNIWYKWGLGSWKERSTGS